MFLVHIKYLYACATGKMGLAAHIQTEERVFNCKSLPTQLVIPAILSQLESFTGMKRAANALPASTLCQNINPHFLYAVKILVCTWASHCIDLSEVSVGKTTEVKFWCKYKTHAEGNIWLLLFVLFLFSYFIKIHSIGKFNCMKITQRVGQIHLTHVSLFCL